MYAGLTSTPRTVGFEADKNAHTVTAYIVVAGDLRDNPQLELALEPVAELCGAVEVNNSTGTAVAITDFPILAGPRDGQTTGRVDRGFCGFNLPDVRVDEAVLRLHQTSVSGTPYVNGDVLIVDDLRYGPTIEVGDYDLAPVQADIGVLSVDATLGFKTLDVTGAVRNALENGHTTAEFRVRFRQDAGVGRAILDGLKDFDGNPSVNPPRLLLKYRLK